MIAIYLAGDATFGEPSYDNGGMDPDKAGSYETTKTSVSNEKYLGNTTIDTTTFTVEVQSGEKEINHDRFLGLWKNEKGEIYEGYKFEKEGKLVGYTMEKRGKRYPPRDISEKNEQRIDGLIELLSKHEDTQIQEQLMMHFWNVYMGRTIYEDVDVDSILDLFDTKITKSISGMSGMNLLRKYILSFEGSTEISPDGTMYRIERDEAAGTLAVGHGVDLIAGGFGEVLAAAGYPTEEGAWVPVDVVDALCDGAITDHVDAVKAATSGLNLEEYQIHALASFCYNLGDDYLDEFVSAYKAYWKETDNLFDGVNTNANLSHGLYTNYFSQYVHAGGEVLPGLVTRRRSEWTLFQTGYYDRLGVWYQEGAGKIISIADEIHQYMVQNRYSYCVYGSNSYEECGTANGNGNSCGLNSTFEASKTGYHHSCCATFVSWVLIEAGYMEPSESRNGAGDVMEHLAKKGWTLITNPAEFQPGDIIADSIGWSASTGHVAANHVEIYAGDGKSYSAGSGDRIRSATLGSSYNMWCSGIVGYRAP